MEGSFGFGGRSWFVPEGRHGRWACTSRPDPRQLMGTSRRLIKFANARGGGSLVD